MSDLTDILADPDFATGDQVNGYTVTRRGAATVTDGVATAGAVTSTFSTGPAVLRPLNGRELQALPEGYHADDVRKLLTTADLRTLDHATGLPADTVTIDGEAWTVFRVATTTAFGGTHRQVWLARGIR